MEEKNINNISEENGNSSENAELDSVIDTTETDAESKNKIEAEIEGENNVNVAPEDNTSEINQLDLAISELDGKTEDAAFADISESETVVEEDNVIYIEEKQTESLITDIPQAPSAAYAFRWDYSEQKRYDDYSKRPTKRSRGVATYIIILSVTFILAAAILAGAIMIGGYKSPSTPMNYSDDLALDALYEYCLPSYVAISTITKSGTEGAGSGIVITADGYISTNYHVVEDAKKITVIASNNKKYEAEYIDGDEINDIAVLKVSAKGLTPAILGDSSSVKVGERVMAIGTPYSVSYAGSMTAGHISGVDRQYAVKNDNGTVNKILKLLQTDTSVNPGNSGGPLFNMNGEVIGVVTMKIAGSNYEGMGFALPIDGVKSMIFDIIQNGKITDSNAGSAVQGAALGISGHAVEADQKYLLTETSCFPVKTDDDGDYIDYQYSSYPYTVEKVYVTDTEALEDIGIVNPRPYTAPCTGVLVRTTSEGFDSREKLQEDDVIASANGVVCETMTVLQEMIFNSRIGDKLELEVYRNGRYHTITVELGKANSME